LVVVAVVGAVDFVDFVGVVVVVDVVVVGIVGVEVGVGGRLSHVVDEVGSEGGFFFLGGGNETGEGVGDLAGCGALGGGVGGDFCGFLEGVDAAAVPALGANFEEFGFAEHAVDEAVAVAAAVFADLVADVVGVAVRFGFGGWGFEEGLRCDEAELFVEDGLFEDGFGGGDIVDMVGVAVGGAAGRGAGGGGDADGLWMSLGHG